MLKKLFPTASAYPALHLTVVDVVLFSEMSKSDEIKFVPTLILDKYADDVKEAAVCAIEQINAR